MVVISIKQADGDGFLFETTTDTLNQDLIRTIVDVHNGRLRAQVVVDSVRGLAEYGVQKEQSLIGNDELQEKLTGIAVEKGPHYKPDPTGMRCGNPPGPAEDKLVQTLRQTALDLEEYVSKNMVQKRIAISSSCLKDKLANVRGAVIMAYPMGLPEYDLVRISLDSDDLKSTFVGNEILDPEKTSLWCAGKEFQCDNNQKVSDRLGKNEKTKVICKLTREGSGAPGREPIVKEEERKAMMAHYFKRQEDLKKLAEADDDDYLNSQWADTREMKRNLQGLGSGIKAPGLRFP